MKNNLLKQYGVYIGAAVLAVIFAVLKLRYMAPVYILQFEALLLFGYILSVSDIRSKRIPNTMILLMLAVWVCINIPQLFIDPEIGIQRLKNSGLGFLLAGIVFFSVYYLSKKGLGGGDVKFMIVAGLYLGYGGVMPAMLIGTVAAALAGMILMACKRLGKKDTMPLVPFLYIGILVTIFLL